jgi:phosphoribosyl 1,2-cyclic phosphodiesterase
MKPSMTIKFWGVRGSIPTPGASTVRYGGNTSCVSIDLGTDKILVLDAGTGIRELGKSLAKRIADIYILLSHNHWDHIQGFPFFILLYQKNQKIYAFPTLQGEELLCSLFDQMNGSYFPVNPEDLPSQYECVPRNAIGFLRNHGFNISRIATNHPDGGYGYRIDNEGRSVVYITDNELAPPYKGITAFDEFIRFCKQSDVLIHDSQYFDQDVPQKYGWGHSVVSKVCELAFAAEVKHLILFHHDPERTDKELDEIQEKARSWFQKNNRGIRCTAAFEGLELKI